MGGGISTSGTTSGTTVDRLGGKTTSAASARRRQGRTSCVGWPRTTGRRNRSSPGEGRESRISSRRRPRLAPAERARRSTGRLDRKSTRLNSSHLVISYAVFCLKKKNVQY